MSNTARRGSRRATKADFQAAIAKAEGAGTVPMSSRANPLPMLEVARALAHAKRAPEVEELIAHAAREFNRERPGYECDVDGDNYDYAAEAHIERRLVERGYEPDEWWDEMWRAIDWIREASSMATTIAYQGGGGREEYAIASPCWQDWERPSNSPAPSRHVLTATPNRMRMAGRAPRQRTNHRARGSRRSSSTTARGDDDGEPGEKPRLHAHADHVEERLEARWVP